MRKLIDKKLRYVSHYSFYRDCIDQNVIPKGLALSIKPSFNFRNSDNTKNWDTTLEATSMQLLKILIKESLTVIKHLDLELKTVVAELTEEEISDLNVFADKKLDELQTDKAKKAHRDGLSLSKVNNDNILPSPNSVSHVTSSPIETSDCAVINLSDTPLTFTECSVLSRGLSFVPTPHAAK